MTEKVIQKFFDDAVAQGLAPGFQFSYCEWRLGLVDAVSGTPFRNDHILSLVSCTKISISIVVLYILEKGLCPNGMTLADLDDHEKLVQVLPEFKHGSTSLVSKIIVGYEKELGPDGKKVPILHDYEGKWWHPFLMEMYQPTDGTPPLKAFPFITGLIEDFVVRPLSRRLQLLFTLNTGFAKSARLSKNLGLDTYWLGQFIVRSTGVNLRQAVKKYIFEPLEIPSSELDMYMPPEHMARKATMHVRSPTGSGFISAALDIYTVEGDPPEGYAHFATGSLLGTLEAYTKVLQAALRHDPRILAETTWKLAVKDALTEQGHMKSLAYDFGQIFKSTIPGEEYASQTVSGRPPGSYGWCGIGNMWYAIDEVTGKGYMFGTQLLPFADPQLMDLKDDFEKLVWAIVQTPEREDLDKELGAHQ
ncbi:hypothetical protein BS47DRAFT_1361694 [Hydnum rufescens UP504]|uniref:Beta-lactamase-related domain-containing protein n=1 Tax=Hydnum rufescens UP504 TaxID=1448309 RepID=A0A9P6AZB4_9AGAM|nr:hypothetical protein BS47DRAFT_1361694 [Hydnum rufescens UP504]